MAAAINEATGIEPKLVKGSGGVFDVEADGKLIFSRHQTGHFPSPEEILAGLKK